MPTCVIAVTTPKSEIPPNFLAEASKCVAKSLGKPEGYVTVRVEPDQMMCHGGSAAPCGSIMIYSIGALGSKNPDHAKAIGGFIEDTLKIPADRYMKACTPSGISNPPRRIQFYITFVDVSGKNCALNKSTFG